MDTDCKKNVKEVSSVIVRHHTYLGSKVKWRSMKEPKIPKLYTSFKLIVIYIPRPPLLKHIIKPYKLLVSGPPVLTLIKVLFPPFFNRDFSMLQLSQLTLFFQISTFVVATVELKDIFILCN